MMRHTYNILYKVVTCGCKRVALLCVCMCAILFAQAQLVDTEVGEVANTPQPIAPTATDSLANVPIATPTLELDSVSLEAMNSMAQSTDTVVPGEVKVFDPDGMRAVWLSALCPGLGQIYNHRYWKLPIVVGGFAGLVYATTWNGRMLADYQQAYLDILDTDPTTNSYMNFFPSYYTEDDIDKAWLTNLLKTRKDAYRHYRDYCIVGMVALYLVCILDAYVDAELYDFDMSPDLSMNIKPALIPISITQRPALGLQCSITF